MKTIILSFFLCFAALANAQNALPKVYDENINQMQQIDQALLKAKAENKFVVCQVGGNWCPWCLRFADFITKDAEIKQTVDDNFVYIHVNYNPRASQSQERKQLEQQMLIRLGSPQRFGFPVFVILNQDGKVIHTQDSALLEEGQSYSKEKVLRFFQHWTPSSLK